MLPFGSCLTTLALALRKLWAFLISPIFLKVEFSIPFLQLLMLSSHSNILQQSLLPPSTSSVVWDPYNNNKKKLELETIQKGASHFILKDYDSHMPGCQCRCATQMVSNLKLEPQLPSVKNNFVNCNTL